MRRIFAVCLLLCVVTLIGCQPPAASLTSVSSLDPTPVPTLQPSVPPEYPVIITATDLPPELATEEVGIDFEAVSAEGYPPPVTVPLPSGWRFLNNTLTLADVDGMVRLIPYSLYTGPVTGGTGYIIMLWGYPALSSDLPDANPRDLLYADGLRLLRLAVLEPQCNIGTDTQRNYRIGLYPAVGTQFAAVDCPELPDTRGWFASMSESTLNFAFYVYTDPITAMDGIAEDELQAILDGVRFNITPDLALTLAPGNATATAQAQLFPTLAPATP